MFIKTTTFIYSSKIMLACGQTHGIYRGLGLVGFFFRKWGRVCLVGVFTIFNSIQTKFNLIESLL